MVKSFPLYALELFIDGTLGIVLGIIVEKISNRIQLDLKLSDTIAIVVQIFISICVLYFMRTKSIFIYDAWKGPENNGTIFTALFLASQENFTHFIVDVRGG